MNGLTEFSDWLVALSNDTERMRLLFVALLGLVGFSLALVLSIFANTILNPVKKRIEEVQSEDSPKSSKRTVNSLLQRLGAFLIPKAEDKRSKLAYKLETAGYRSPRAMAYFYGIKLVGFILAPLLVLGGITLFTNRPVLDDLSYAIFAGAIAFLAPGFLLDRAVKKRQKQLRHALPDALDLMVALKIVDQHLQHAGTGNHQYDNNRRQFWNKGQSLFLNRGRSLKHRHQQSHRQRR